jgi:hypothetical protein
MSLTSSIPSLVIIGTPGGSPVVTKQEMYLNGID